MEHTTCPDIPRPDNYTRTKPRKGKPLPKDHLVRFMREHEGHRIVVSGPDFVGCTTLLHRLVQLGYTTLQLARKPPAAERHTFSAPHFHDLVQAWAAMPTDRRSYLVEDSPWAYLTRHLPGIAPQDHAAHLAELAGLTPPTFTILLHTSGVAVGRRHPLHR